MVYCPYMYTHAYIRIPSFNLQTADRKDLPPLSAGLQPENEDIKKKIIHTHVHIHNYAHKICVFEGDCLPVWLACLLDHIIPPQKSIDAKCLICAAGNHNFVGFKEIHYSHVWNTAWSPRHQQF